MFNPNDFAIVIQGPAEDAPAFIAGLPNYSKVAAQVIVATNGELSDATKKWARNNCPFISFHSTGLFEVPKSIFNRQNIYRQAYSTLLGLRQVTTPYAVKLRTDEYYFNLAPIFEALSQNPDKIISTNIFFKCTEAYPYHMSDHLYAAKAALLRNALSLLVDACEHTLSALPPHDPKIPITDRNDVRTGVPEQRIAWSIFQAMGIEPDEKLASDHMLKHFLIVQRQLLKPFRISFTETTTNGQLVRRASTDDMDVLPEMEGTIDDIRDIDLSLNRATPYYMNPNYDWGTDQRWRNDPAAIQHRNIMMQGIKVF